METILEGMPVNTADRAQLERLTGRPIPPRRDDDVSRACRACRMPIWLRREQQAYLHQHPQTPIVCPLCLKMLTGQEEGGLEMAQR